MTKIGVGFIAGGVVVYVLGTYTQIGWLYLFDAMIWSIVVLSAFFPWWSLRSLRVERQVWLPRSSNGRQDPATPTEDGTVEVRLTLRNRGRLARYFIKVVEDCPLDEPSKRTRTFFLSSVKPRSAVAFSYTATCYRRGRYASAKAIIEMGAPFGLFVRRRRCNLPFNVTVYPAYHAMEGVPVAREGWADHGHVVKSDAAAELYGSREYRYGDPLRYIHWRNTARLGQFVVKQFEEARRGSVAVAFETMRDWGLAKETTLEYSIKIAASLARCCADSGRSVGILAGQAPLPRAEWLQAMEYLAGLAVGDSPRLEELTAATEPGSTLVTIVPATEPRLIPCLLRRANGDEHMVVVVLEGFAPDERPQEFVTRLNGSKLAVVRCSRGDLKATIGALSRSRVFAA